MAINLRLLLQKFFLGALCVSAIKRLYRLVRSDLDGTLDFYWRIKPAAGKGELSAFRVIGFDEFVLDVDWCIDGLGDVAPDIARYFGDGSGAVNFLFRDEVGNFATGGYEESVFFFWIRMQLVMI